MKTIIVHAVSDKMKKITEYLKELKVAFETGDEDSPYNPDFVEKIKKSRKQYKESNYSTVAQEDLEKYI
ncbi:MULTISPECIES: DUF2683 family protein [Aequorivita]|uniref:DUF2683 family protein n=2 Tax=Aequorivita TaxID=153265 RepID=A0AB35YNL5_9FLAO|nr:DUF2683 family protein [Aequorivita sp. Ant34-E75]WGF91410.1 hypothetical protein QCQ61_09305 [Aequorivita sp. Ant34-E75]